MRVKSCEMIKQLRMKCGRTLFLDKPWQTHLVCFLKDHVIAGTWSQNLLVITWRRQGLFDLLLVRQWYQSQSWTISLFIPMDPRWPTAGNRSWRTGLCRIQPRGWIRWTTAVVAHSQSFRWFGNWRDCHVRLVCGYSIDVITLQSMMDSERDASVDSWRTRCTSIGVLLTSLFFLVATFLSGECIASKS